MEPISQRYSFSVMSYITLSLTAILAVGLMTIFISFWVTELADKDAQAINLSGSMRMQTYHIGLALERGENQQALAYIDQLNQTWNHSLFTQQQKASTDQEWDSVFKQAYGHWRDTLRPQLIKIAENRHSGPAPMALLDKQVVLTDKVVGRFQQDAESKIRHLRAIQLFALFVTICVGSVIFYLIKNRVERPLQQLTEASRKIGEGDFGHQVGIEGRDELSLLGEVINQMSLSISEMYDEMDERVKQRTLELRRNNTTLEFLFNTARKILDNPNATLDYQELLNELSATTKGQVALELCLFTAQGQRPYLQVVPDKHPPEECGSLSCQECLGAAPFTVLKSDSLLNPREAKDTITISSMVNNAGMVKNAGVINNTVVEKNLTVNERFPIVRNETHYGVINARSSNVAPLEPWQGQLLRSVADQLALALSLSGQKDQERRLAMLSERTVIARELHDSLAQALSYLKIQVTRLQKSKDKERYELQQPIIDELREGLSSAYRQLRELLTTFRLKMDTGGLKTALEMTAEQLRERTDMKIKLHYHLANLPLSPTEEIHLLQFIREASQNAVNHSKGSRVDISLEQLENKSVELTIDDDGIGIPDSPEKLNHYGLAIMNERSRHLGGKVSITLRPEGGTRVAFNFQPSFLEQNV